jgi:neutral ceramidase
MTKLSRLLCWSTIFLAASPCAVSSEPLQVGVAVVDITPLPGYRMSGYFSERLNTGTRDPLLAKAIVLKQGDTTAALVSCDLVGLALDVSNRARRAVEQLAGIPAANISIFATHSHTGPLYFGALRQHFHNNAMAREGRDPHEVVDYSTELIGRLVRAILAAQKDLRAVTLKAGDALEKRLSFNRRFHMKDGTVRFNPGHLNPNVVRAAGPIDSEVGLISFTAVDASKPTAALVVFALHLDTVGGSLYSADFPRYVQDALRQTYGKEFLSVFGAGTCGDINHVDVTRKAPDGRRRTDQIGTMLAETVAQELPALEAVEGPSLAVKHALVNAPLQTFSPERVAHARLTIERVDDRGVPFLDRVEAYKIMALELRGGETIPLEVHAFRLSGKVAIVTLPGEVFVELGMAIKQASPFETTIVIELANDAPGYIPTRKAFAEGSYETVNSRVVPGSGEALVKVAVQLLDELALGPTASVR